MEINFFMNNKLKVHSGSKKRFKKCKNKIKMRRAKRNHILTKYSSQYKNNMKKTSYVHKNDFKRIKNLLNI